LSLEAGFKSFYPSHRHRQGDDRHGTPRFLARYMPFSHRFRCERRGHRSLYAADGPADPL